MNHYLSARAPALHGGVLHATVSVCRRYPWCRHVVSGLVAYILTSIPVWLGVVFAISFCPEDKELPSTPSQAFLRACAHFDGAYYGQIVEHGYTYNPDRPSTVAFFPVYPLVARIGITLTGLSACAALLCVSNVMLLAAFILFDVYLRFRCSDGVVAPDQLLALAIFGLWPAGLFFRMTYSESTFVAVALLVLIGMVRRWPVVILALLAGLATGVRPVGVALTAALLVYVLCDSSRGVVTRRSLLALGSLPLACWGLIAYMGYQYAAFGTPLAFAHTQDHWHLVSAAYHGPGHKIHALLTAEPIWSIYTSDVVGNWQQLNPDDPVATNVFFWNPLFFVGVLAAVLFGFYKGWLTGPEALLGLGLLVIPYVTRAYEMSMASHARFTDVVVPAYIVCARLLQLLPVWMTWCALSFMSTMLMTWSALFAAGHLVI